ncbi:MAG TPA: class I SAM-dependent methyltransferase [Sphingomicrobium sp.]|nr:class I SAM-dependent methyltransferase [Sphingomicrobium sp.]
MKDQLREFWHRGRLAAARQLRFTVPGRFQPYRHTLPDRYPWLFGFARDALGHIAQPRLLSFGCSIGDELESLRGAFPTALIRGVDISPVAIARCRARFGSDDRISLAVAADTRNEGDGDYDAVFCLAVLCHGDLTRLGAPRSDSLFSFQSFERAVADLARCVRRGGFLFLHAANYRFGDTSTAAQFETVLHAQGDQIATGLLYDRENRLIVNGRYSPAGFRKGTARQI